MMERKDIESIGWMHERSTKFGDMHYRGDKPDCITFKWKERKDNWNKPSLTLYKSGYVIITKYVGNNDYYGKYQAVFDGWIRNINILKIIQSTLRLNKYLHLYR